jgi:hypothetical protein
MVGLEQPRRAKRPANFQLGIAVWVEQPRGLDDADISDLITRHRRVHPVQPDPADMRQENW